MVKTIVCMVGSFGSGCTSLAKKYLVPMGYKYYSLSDRLRQLLAETTGSLVPPTREEQQNFGDELRKTKGPAYFAKEAKEFINSQTEEKWIVDSIRNPAEIDFLKIDYPGVYVFGIYADFDNRWERVKDIYNSNMGVFERDDKRDQEETPDYGQNVRTCFLKSDIIISNNLVLITDNDVDLKMKALFDKYIGIIEGRLIYVPTDIEAIMAIAYANSMRSSCEKRKVGAILLDCFGQIFSSGFNEVPKDMKPCKEAFGKCFRSYRKDTLEKEIDSQLTAKNKALKPDLMKSISSTFKDLEHCRALHAEEEAILGVARSGAAKSLTKAHLVTTTYPCNLCANKIVQVGGITEVTYLEPYPMKEAKETLSKNGITQTPFEGVLFNGYFRFLRSKPS